MNASPASPPRVCQVVHSLNVGGAELLAAEFARHLGGPQHVVFACLDEDGLLGNTLRQEGFTVHSLQRQPGLDRRCVASLAQFLREQSIELVHCQQYTPFFYSTLARGLHSSPPILFTEHGRFFPDPPNRKRQLLNRFLFGRRDRIVAVGECVRRALVVLDGLPAQRVEVIYNGIPVDRYQPDPAVRHAVRAELGLAADQPVVIHVARLDPIKDHLSALAAFDAVRQAHPSARLLIVGDGPERQRITQQVTSRRLESTVQLLGTRRDVPHLLAAADIFLLNSLSEGIPLTLLEAMASGLPVVCTRVGGMPEVVDDGRTGLLVPPRDPPALAQVLAQLIAQPQHRTAFGLAAAAHVRQRFSDSLMLAHYRQTYAAMVGRPLPTMERTP